MQAVGREAAFGRVFDSGVDVPEWLPVACETLFDGLVVDSTQGTHIAGGGVQANAFLLEPQFVGRSHAWREVLKPQVFLLAEAAERVQGRAIVA